MLIDTDGTYRFLNPEFTAITGYTINEIPNGQRWFRTAYPDPSYRHDVVQAWKRDITATGATRVFTVTCKDGTRKEIEFRPTLLDDGRAIMMLSDITERKRMEEQLRQERDRLAAFTQMLESKITERNREVAEFRRFLDQLSTLKDQLVSPEEPEPARQLLPTSLYEGLVYIYNQNTVNLKPTYTDFQHALGISRATARQRIGELESRNLITIETAGRSKYLTVTMEGKNLILLQ
jgi:PAS domain S-box-containing protein